MNRITLHRTLNSKRNETGVALIIVLLIVALVAVLATQMTNRLQLNVARTMNIKDNNQAYWYALGAEQFAKKSLRTLIQSTPDNINLGQPWANPFEFPLENGVIRAQLIDMQACFNINGANSLDNVQDTADEDEAANNQQNEGQDNENASTTENTQPQNIARELSDKPASLLALEDLLNQFIDDSLVVDTVRDSIIDWLDEDDFSNTYGAEDIDYESLPQPYLTANNQLANISELRLINGFDEVIKRGWMNSLLTHLCVIPESEYKLNVNTVTSENAAVLAALTGLSVEDAQQVINERPENGYDEIDEFLSDNNIAILGLPPERLNWFDVTTKYFKLITSVETITGSEFTQVTLFSLEDDQVSIVGREFGGI